MKHQGRLKRSVGVGAGVAAVLAVLLAGGCASTPDPHLQRLAAAEAGVEQARSSGASRYANADLSRARSKLERARRAADDGDEALAERLAHEAEVDAEYAAVAAESAKLQEAVHAIRESIESLRQELRTDRRG